MTGAIFGITLLLLQAGPDATFRDLASRAAAALERNPEEAIALYRQATSLRPSWAEGWFYTGAALYQLNRYPECRDAFEHVVSLAPGKGTAWGFLGLCEY